MAPRTRAAARAAAAAALEEAGPQVFAVMMDRKRASVARWRAACEAAAERAKEISAGDEHSLALRKDGTVACWGSNSSGRAPPEGRDDGPFVAVSAGQEHSLALREDGTVACWGDNEYGQAPPEGRADGPYGTH